MSRGYHARIPLRRPPFLAKCVTSPTFVCYFSRGCALSWRGVNAGISADLELRDALWRARTGQQRSRSRRGFGSWIITTAHAAGARSGAALCLSRRYSPHPSLTPPIRGALLFSVPLPTRSHPCCAALISLRPAIIRCAACLAGAAAVAIFTGARCIGSVSALLLARTVMAALLWRVAVFAQPG